MRIFINEHPFDAPDGADVAGVIRVYDSALAEGLQSGRAYVTDGRGIRLTGAEQLQAGAILRVVVSARRVDATDVDA